MSLRKTPKKKIQFGAGLMIQVAVLMTLAVFRSDKLVSFTYDLAPNNFNDQIVSLAEDWNELMNAAGMTRIAPEVEDMIEKLRGDLGG